jgi:ubiquinone/menaquinone biosynthesis C-methylase UbiE
METALRIKGFAEVYERVLVPSIFEPWSHEIVARARPIGPSDRILDLGCGTGIVARKLRERLGGGARITGVDASAEMIAAARTLAPEIEWREANAMSLPFDDASFDLVVCQHMLQFTPDPLVALAEARRILVPGGRLVLATWRPRHELAFFETLGKIAERHLGTPNEKRFRLGDDDALRKLVVESGFGDVAIETVTRTEVHPSFPYRGNVFAANFDLSSLSDAEREAKLAAVETESASAAKAFVVDGMVHAVTRANLVTATKHRGER